MEKGERLGGGQPETLDRGRLFSFIMKESKICLHAEENNQQRKRLKPQEKWVTINGTTLGEMRGN